MKNFFKNWKADLFRDRILEVVNRFPVSVLIAVISSTLTSYMIASGVSSESTMIRLIVTTIPTFFLSVGVYLTAESWKLKKLETHLLQIITGGFAAGFYMTLQNSMNGVFDSDVSFWLNAAGFISLIFIAPFIRTSIKGKYKQASYYEYFYHIGMIFVITAILAAALQILGFVAIASIFELFDLQAFRNGDVYGHWTTFTCLLVAPIFALTKIPAADKMEKLESGENAFFSFLIRYIGVPFIYLYFLILYAYTIKVLMHFGEWPKGQVTWMVVGFSAFGYLLYVCSYRLERSALVAVFRKYFPFAVLPQLAMLFYAIYLRIAQYDITDNRYFVVAFGVFLLSISIYYAISREKRLIAVPLALAIVILLISIGPWSVHKLPESRQYNRLVSNLEKANILKDGKITPPKAGTEVDQVLSGEIYSGIQYLCNSTHCDQIKELFHEQIGGLQEPNNSYMVVERITTTIRVSRTIESRDMGNYINLRTTYSNGPFPLSTKGYDYFVQISNMNEPSPTPKQAVRVSINSDTNEVTVYENDQKTETISIKDQLDKLAKAHLTSQYYLEPNALDFSAEGQKYSLKFLPSQIDVKSADNVGNKGMSSYQNVGYVLVKHK